MSESANAATLGNGKTAGTGRLKAVHFASVAALGGFLFGYDTAVINGAVTAIREHFQIDSVATGITVAIALLGSAAGAWWAGSLADKFGRLFAMRLAAVLFLVSAIGSAVPFTAWDMSWWRLVGGVAVGMASVIAPAYIAEIAPAAHRGRLGTLQQLAIVLGIALSQVANWAIAAAAGGAGSALGPLDAWQWMLMAEAAPAILFGILTFTIPESPRHLVANGRSEDARSILRSIEPQDTEQRLAEIQESLDREHKPRLADLRSKTAVLLPIVWIGIVLSMLQQLVGINVIFYYSSALWQSVGINEDSSLLLSLSTQVFNIAGTLVALALLDRVGRRPLLLTGSAGMTVTLGLAAFAFSHAGVVNGEPAMPDPYGMIALVSAHAFVFFFAISWGPVVWVLLGEMFPNRIRAAALAVAAAAQWLTNWLVTVSFPTLSELSLSGAYIGYTVFAALSIYFVWKWIPETKGRTLEEMS
ncbi:sugar porter family MFS transporter [Saccharopolyspora griseoalba]|uniref:Sugar porter family MFS transporter n=1 Tax=Saccharopolyspora griseoalba TaxID=1431848 RepID=A0ABW2LD55_9PSEU